MAACLVAAHPAARGAGLRAASVDVLGGVKPCLPIRQLLLMPLLDVAVATVDVSGAGVAALAFIAFGAFAATAASFGGEGRAFITFIACVAWQAFITFMVSMAFGAWYVKVNASPVLMMCMSTIAARVIPMTAGVR